MTTVFSLLWEEGKNRKRNGGDAGSAKVEVAGAKSKPPKLVGARRTGSRPRGYLSARGTRVNAIVKSKYVARGRDSQRHIIQHVYYIAERNQKEWEKRQFFNKDRIDIGRDAVIRHLSTHQGREVSMHKVILSPGDNSVNLKDYTRECMERLEETLGYKVDWFAVQHENTDHYHVHVVIAGRIPEQERQVSETDRAELEKHLEKWAKHMEGRDLKIFRYNLDTLREAGNDFLLKERSIDRALDQAIEKELGFENWTYDRYVEQELGLKIWNQDKDYVERELGLTTAEQDYWIQKGLGLGTPEGDRAAMKELGLGKFYDLGRPFKNDSDSRELYKLGSEPGERAVGQERDAHDPLASDLYRDTTESSVKHREELDRDPLETNLPKLIFNLQSAPSSRPEMDRGEDTLSQALYHQEEHDLSEQLSELEMKLFEGENGDERDRDDDERSQRGQHNRGEM